MTRSRTRHRHQHQRAPKHSLVEWGIRLLLAASAGVLGYEAVVYAVACSIAALNPERAYHLAPYDGRIAAALSEKSFDTDTGTPSPAQQTQSAALARWALLQEPTAVAAVTTLGLDATLQNNQPAAGRLLAYAQALSRRNFRTQLWAIEDAVNRGDIAGALHSYDIALRTSSRAPDILYPILASAISDPSIRSGLIRILAQQPDWGDSFLNHTAFNGPDLPAIAALFQALQHVGFPIDDRASAAVINRLITDNRFEDAWNYYAATHPGANRRTARDPQFIAGPSNPSWFDWVPVNATGINSGIQKGNGDGFFYFSAPASIGGIALQQMQMLPPGEYTIQGKSAEIDQPPASRPYLILKCLDGDEIYRIYLPNSYENNGIFSGNFQVANDCPNQVLIFMLRSSDKISGISGKLEQLILKPSGR